MANSIIMPKTGMAMEEGIIIEWRVKEGDTVAKGDVVALIETDKSTMELESDYDGVILAVLGRAGEAVPVTKVIAWVGQPGEAVPPDASPGTAVSGPAVPGGKAPASPSGDRVSGPAGGSAMVSAGPAAGGKVRATPAARILAKEKAVDLAAVPPGGKYGEIRRADVERAAGASVPATPLAKRMAADAGISLAGISGSGHGGKIFSADLAAAVSGRRTGAEAGEDVRTALTNIQRITGRRMAESRRTIPEVTAQIRPDVSRLLELRRELNDTLAGSGVRAKITINDFVLAAAVKALSAHPRMNSVLDGDELVYKGAVNLGMAVASERGLLVPVIRSARDYTLAGLSARAAELAAKAREGKLTPDEMAGGTFTVSNIGMYGVTAFTPIINPPEAAILGVCAVEDELKLDGEKVVNRKKMGLSLAYDHRIVDGAESSLFLKNLKDILEAPLLCLL
ncbi:MAG: 2-oxo acid dehydrogenase subunit E2 [Spirochaetaceae bacterium]|jgi:pyruvate dehydrogenase E2 component (dihydrolipoamide acetyltransferase)|nr:2-oxo acid dehydrogenase subunit E2 [Spirochaetaceae bacterium]